MLRGKEARVTFYKHPAIALTWYVNSAYYFKNYTSSLPIYHGWRFGSIEQARSVVDYLKEEYKFPAYVKETRDNIVLLTFADEADEAEFIMKSSNNDIIVYIKCS